MPLSKAAKARRRASAEENARRKYGPDWQPTRCEFCIRSEPIKRCAVVLPVDASHPDNRTIFAFASVQPHSDGTLIPTGRKVGWHARYGADARPVAEFRFATEDDPPGPRHRIHNARNCVDAELDEWVPSTWATS